MWLLCRRFAIPQSARIALSESAQGANRSQAKEDSIASRLGEGFDTDSSPAGKSGGSIDFAALEKEVLRITALGAKQTRNPLTPLPGAVSGPFSPAGRDFK